MNIDVDVFLAGLSDVVAKNVADVVGPLRAKIAALEKQIADMPVPINGNDGKDGVGIEKIYMTDSGGLHIGTTDSVVHVFENLRGAPGKDADPALIKAMVDESVAKIPPAKDGTPGEPGVKGDPGPPGRDGRDFDVDGAIKLLSEMSAARAALSDVQASGISDEALLVAEKALATAEAAVQKLAELKAEIVDTIISSVGAQIAAMPKPENGKDGESISVEDLQPTIEAAVERAVAALPEPVEPIHVSGAVIDREGNLVLNLSNGETKSLGVVVGRDADEATMMAALKAEIAKIPAGKDGRDGFGFDDISVVHDGERTIAIRFQRGIEVKEFPVKFDVPLYRGVWKQGGKYQKGDIVTWGGSAWAAQRDTADKPETSDAWQLSVKKGRNGKDGDRGSPGEPGRDGKDGKPPKW